MIEITRAPAYLTIQDLGRPGFLASGVPRSGAMDRAALMTLNTMLGGDRGNAGLEWALTGGELLFHESATFAIGGAAASATLSGVPLESYRAYRAGPGDRLNVDHLIDGRFLYLALVGGLDCKRVLGSRSTYLPGAFGGLDGRRVRHDDRLKARVSRTPQRRHQVTDPLPVALRPPVSAGPIRIVRRAEGSEGETESLERVFVVSEASDRTGYRLEGATTIRGASVTSEPVCPGTVQIPPGGELIVLMADAPTIGGYRIAGAVISSDMGRLAQLAPGANVTLESVSVQQAQQEMHRQDEILLRVSDWALG